jgi:hypothetical protein
MSNVIVALVDIVERVPNIYNTDERCVVEKMILEYVNKIVAIFPIIYQIDKVRYFNNKSTI